MSMFAAVLGMLVIAVGYQVQTSTDDVAEAAGQAARAASMAAAPAQAAAAAQATARLRLAVGACRPGSIDVSSDLSDFHAGGVINITVACVTNLPLLGPHTSRATSREVIDRYRGGL